MWRKVLTIIIVVFIFGIILGYALFPPEKKSEYLPDEIVTPANNYPYQPSQRALEFQRNLPAWLEESRTRERIQEAENEAPQLKLRGWEIQLKPEEMEEYLQQQRQFLLNPGPPIGVPDEFFK